MESDWVGGPLRGWGAGMETWAPDPLNRQGHMGIYQIGQHCMDPIAVATGPRTICHMSVPIQPIRLTGCWMYFTGNRGGGALHLTLLFS